MQKKIIARLILGIAFAAICAVLGLIMVLSKQPDLLIEGNLCCHKEYRFCFRIPSNWEVRRASDKDDVKILLGRYGNKNNLAAYLPIIGITYEKVSLARETPSWKMDKDYAEIKKQSENYPNLILEFKDTNKYPEFTEGRLGYTFDSIAAKERQSTEIRYLLRKGFLISFQLTDFKARFNTKPLEEIVASVRFS